MANTPPFLAAGEGAGVGTGGPDMGSMQTPDGSPHDGAPAGLVPSEGELPSVAVPGGQPFTTGGYSPDASQDSLPTPGSTEGNQTAPSGVRR